MEMNDKTSHPAIAGKMADIIFFSPLQKLLALSIGGYVIILKILHKFQIKVSRTTMSSLTWESRDRRCR